jgi:hypothetical protein
MSLMISRALSVSLKHGADTSQRRLWKHLFSLIHEAAIFASWAVMSRSFVELAMTQTTSRFPLISAMIYQHNTPDKMNS